MEENVQNTFFFVFWEQFFPLYKIVSVNNTANIFHRSKIVIRNENLVQLSKGVFCGKQLFIVINSTFCDMEVLFFLLFDVFLNRLSAENSQGEPIV